jgi:peptidoglycan/xylan/chitin deacetylase (PgdA/CDA1 family)
MLVVHDVPPTRQGAFVRLLEHCRDRFGFVTPNEAVARLSGHCVADGRAPVLLTFDDGFSSNGIVARGVLDPLGVKALFFVCPGLIDGPPATRRAQIAAHVFRGRVTANDLPSGLDLMEWADLRDLETSGHTIGCHSLSHDCLAGLGIDALSHQVATAKQRLEAELGECSPWFAFPFGDITSIDKAALAAIGRHFPLCRSGVRGLAHADSPPLALPAESVDLTESWAWQQLTAAGVLAPLYRGARARLADMAEAS